MEDRATIIAATLFAQIERLEMGILDCAYDIESQHIEDNKRRLELIEKVLESEGGIRNSSLLAGLIFVAMPRVDPMVPPSDAVKNAFADYLRAQLNKAQ